MKDSSRSAIEGNYACPCCGALVLELPPPGSYEICPVCGWEDDLVQYSDPDFAGGANIMSLNQAREVYACREKE